MTMSVWNPRWWFLLLIFGQVHVLDARATWPLATSSGRQILGLFPDNPNTTNSTTLSIHSRAMFKAAILLSQQYNITIDGQFIQWQTAGTGGNGMDGLSSTCQATFAFDIVGIVGPALSKETPTIADFAQRVGIPAVSYAATAPDLSNRNIYPALYRTIPSDNAAARAIAKLFVRFNWTSCIVIYQNDAFGSGGANAINEVFLKNSLTVQTTVVFDTTTNDFRVNLKQTLTNSSARIVILWAFSSYTTVIIQKALNSNLLGPLFTWILSSSISLNSFDQTFYPNLIGMLTVEPSIANAVNAPFNSSLLNAAYSIWQQYEPETFPGSSNVNNYALFAFDATWLLIQSLQQLCSTSSNPFSSCISFLNSSSCFNRHFLNSSSFFNTINNMSFLGVSGLIQFSTTATDRINSSYYYAQNAQSFSDGMDFVPVLDYSDSNGWQRYAGISTVIWPGNTLSIPTGYAKLNGVRLRVGLISSVPYTIVSTTTDSSGHVKQTFTGYAPDLVSLLQSRTGLIADLYLAPTNWSYIAVVQSVANGVYDIVVGDVTVTSDRAKIIDFSNAIYDNSLRIVMRKESNIDVDLVSFLAPFSRDLWLLILGVTIGTALLFGLFEKTENEILEKRSTMSLFAMSTWYCFGNLAGYGAGFQSRTAAGRLLTTGLYILCLILIASYTANLASDLTIYKSKSIISGLDDIKRGKIPFSRIGIRVGSASEDFYLREISNGVRNYHPLRDKPETYASLFNRTIDLSLMDVGVAEYITNNIYCNLTIVGEDFNKGIMSIVTPKQWPYLRELDVTILTLRELGVLDDLNAKWVLTKMCPVETGVSTAMDIDTMSGLFLIFGIISIASIILSIWTKRRAIRDRIFSCIGRKSSSD